MASGADDDLKNYAADNSPQLAIINDDNPKNRS
jgi:hypothetical protein